ncbi:MAG: hypothetical protein WCV67_12765 [Victivallaceae bacterium]|jgi:hypothetical protein
MIKIIEILIDDILNDAAACSEIINGAVKRHPELSVTGVCASESLVFVSLEDTVSMPDKMQYRFAVLSELDNDLIAAAMKSRYYAGFTTMGSFISGNTVWALFAGPANQSTTKQ